LRTLPIAKPLLFAVQSIEPFWHIYRQHFSSDLPTRLMEHMVVGKLTEEDQEAIDEQMEALYDTQEDPYSLEPLRHTALKVHSDQPMNAEVPEELLTQHYLTPPSLFYIRNHHPVPHLTEDQIKNYNVEIDLSAYGKDTLKISLDDLKKMPKVEVTATLQCSGNRRSGFNEFERTSGTKWGQGAISTAKWGGVRLRDLLTHAGLEDPIDAQENGKMEHVRFHSLDGMMASIGIEKAMNPYGDVVLCYEMNGDRSYRLACQARLKLASLRNKWGLSSEKRNLEIKSLLDSVLSCDQFADLTAEAIKLKNLCDGISRAEIKQVLAAMNVDGGYDYGGGWAAHWYECENGHPYFIGDCGQAMESSNCPECGAPVGGASHTLHSTNRNVSGMVSDELRIG
jgi:hypothetical protein